MRASVLLCLGGLWVVAPANCQTSAGAIVGVVRDASGPKPDRKHFNTERMDVTGDPLPSGFNRTYKHQFDTSVFATPTLGTLGNGERNILRSTGQRAMDMSFFKNFSLWEKANLQFRGEIFNLPSSHFYSPLFPTATPTATNFGSLIPVGGDHGNLFNPRIIQFDLKLLF